ncbi:methyltransferase domain-containing protein [Ktedonosporobacter rubrisoli]|nr:methyltransferase domain-containing protein [Ktedonosporobacter rubrisoli]
MSSSEALVEHKVPFANPFQIEDLQVFDDDTLRTMLASGSFGLTIEQLAHSMRGASNSLVKRIRHNLSPQQRADFMREFRRSILKCEVDRARRTVLDTLFWELTYWKTPELYEELTQGEYLHPGIFEHLEADIRGKLVLDVGAGSGRASFECKRYGARKIYAVEPSPGLLRILEHKLATRDRDNRIVTYAGRFEDIPLPDNSVDCALSCSAFTSSPGQGESQAWLNCGA